MDTRRRLLDSLYAFFLGIPWQNVPNTTSLSLEDRTNMAFLRADAYVQRETLSEAEPESYAGPLAAGENLFRDDSIYPVSALQCTRRILCLLSCWSLVFYILTAFCEKDLLSFPT
jgi:hypothetical protein